MFIDVYAKTFKNKIYDIYEQCIMRLSYVIKDVQNNGVLSCDGFHPGRQGTPDIFQPWGLRPPAVSGV